MKDVEPGKVYRLFYPSVPVIVASRLGEVVSAMPVVSILSLSNSPAMVGFSSSPTHATYRTTVSSRAFSVSWMGREHTRSVELLGGRTGEGVRDKLGSAGLRHRGGRVLDVPVPEAAAASLECSLVETRGFGDHHLLVGEVKAAYATGDFSEYWQFRDYHPILYAGSPGTFRTLTV